MNLPGIRLMIATTTFVLGVTATLAWVAVRKPILQVDKSLMERCLTKSPAAEPSVKPPTDDSIAGTVLALRAAGEDSVDEGVPPAVQNLIVKLKHQLRDFIQKNLSEHASENDSLGQLETMLNGELEKAGVHITRDTDEINDGSTYGEVYEFKISRPAGHHGLVAVTSDIGICCGEDTSLYLFKYEPHDWNLILAYESEAYDRIDGAHALLKYAISPPENNGDFFVVVANVTPWCTSNWQTLRYMVLKPVIGTYEPKVILSKTNSIFLGSDPPYELTLETRGFRLSLFDEKMMEMANEGKDTGPDGIKARRFISYRVKGNSAILRFRR